ncbi:S1 family peptidase [Isoptericola rhizosphaerae]|uniref:S1 family peptidase n=1 Tax=Isoptericola rhizosphaerae TaxID=3377837 RepID=UPI00383AC6F3
MKNRTQIRGAGVLVVALSLTAGVTAGALAASDAAEGAPDVFVLQGEGIVAAPSDDLIDDIAAVRGSESVDLEDPLLWQNDFSVAVTTLQEQYPKAYSASAVDTDAGQAWVPFAQDAPAGALALLGELPVDIEIREGVGWSEEEIASVGEQAHYAALKETASFKDVYTNTDAASGRVSVYVEPADGMSIDRARSALSSVEARSDVARSAEASGVPGIEVEYFVDVDLDGGLDAIYGGGKLTSGSSYCTSGFSVRKGTTYNNGLITAAHCPNTLKYGSNSLNFRKASSTRDVQWHSDNQTAPPKFYVADTTLRNVDVSSNPPVGTRVCRYGRTNDATCDRVALLNQCRGNYCGLAMVYERRAAPGDSGGPWYYGNVAYGVHSGYITIDSQRRDVFTPLQKAVTHLDIGTKL